MKRFYRAAGRSHGRLRRLVEVRRRQPPFFKTLRDLLAQDEPKTLGDFMEAAGEQTYGLLILLLALPNLIPGLNLGTAPVSGLAILWLGIQMALGRSHPSLPERLKRQTLHRGWVEESLARLEGYLERLGSRSRVRQALNRRWVGILVAWTAFLLAIPVPLPFGNILPSGALVLLGAALVEERPFWGWLGALASIATTIYFGMSYELIVYACLKVFRALLSWVS